MTCTGTPVQSWSGSISFVDPEVVIDIRAHIKLAFPGGFDAGTLAVDARDLLEVLATGIAPIDDIMAGAFLALWFSNLLILTEIGLGMVFAVIVDATIVRVFLVPAAMAIMGDKYNWWPKWVNERFGKLTH